MSCLFHSIKPRAAAAMLLVAALFSCPALAAKHKPAEAPPPFRSTQPPMCTIPAAALGFAPPGEIYLGMRYSLVSLDFLDEDRLLFTFRVPGLFRRDPTRAPGEIERHIRAVVLHIPDGAVQAEALWTLHDYGHYLYMLNGGQFVVRDRDTLSLGDSSLQLTPWLHFPGPLLWIELDPTHQYVVAGSTEPATTNPRSGDVPGPSTAQASITPTGDAAALQNQGSDTVLRILERSSGQDMLVSHVRTPVHVPLNSQGYLETLRGQGDSWMVQLDYFTGGVTRIGAVNSTCVPTLDFLSLKEFVASVCNGSDARTFVAMTSDGRRLWQVSAPDNYIWPNLGLSQSGSRLSLETLRATHPVNAHSPLGDGDIERQEVAILDAATGQTALHAEASPIYDAGGNVALSPSGRRAAILMEDGIEIFDLPGAPPVPAPKPQ
jgi:hypothetical protein